MREKNEDYEVGDKVLVRGSLKEAWVMAVVTDVSVLDEREARALLGILGPGIEAGSTRLLLRDNNNDERTAIIAVHDVRKLGF